MKRSTRVLLGVASFWPPVYLFGFIVGWGLLLFSILKSVSMGRQPGFTAIPPSSSAVLFSLILTMHLLTIFGSLALAVFYIVDMYRYDRVTQQMKIFWAVLLALMAVFALPVYWYMHIRRLPDAGGE